MIACEKLRAICQQMASYAGFVKKYRAPRARDFFDIWNIIRRFNIEMTAPENLRLLHDMFDAKRVPLDLLLRVEEDREFHRPDWLAVQETVDPEIQLKPFDFYFNKVAELSVKLSQAIPD